MKSIPFHPSHKTVSQPWKHDKDETQTEAEKEIIRWKKFPYLLGKNGQ